MSELVVLRDGGRFLVRPMVAGDADAVRTGYASLSPEDLRLRFFSPVPRLTAGMLADLTALDPGRIVLLAFAAGDGSLAGGVRAIRWRADPTVADVAVTVGEHHRGRGLGLALLDRIRRAARREGIERLGGHVLVDNVAARAILRRAGATTAFDEPGVLRFDIPLVTPVTPATPVTPTTPTTVPAALAS